jgi:hypothetical protein
VAPDLSLASTEIKIHKIISNSGDSIEFKIKPGQRMDYHSHSAFFLDEIVLHRADGMLKKFKLYTSYFEDNNNEKYVAESGGIDLPHLNYRLRLTPGRGQQGRRRINLNTIALRSRIIWIGECMITRHVIMIRQ